jgi:hypothetical protein
MDASPFISSKLNPHRPAKERNPGGGVQEGEMARRIKGGNNGEVGGDGQGCGASWLLCDPGDLDVCPPVSSPTSNYINAESYKLLHQFTGIPPICAYQDWKPGASDSIVE